MTEIRTDHYHYYVTNTGEYWGSHIVPPQDNTLSYTHVEPPGRDIFTEKLMWTGSDWQLVNI